MLHGRHVSMRYAVGCKPREAVLYPDTVAGANPKVGPYCSSRWLLEGLWLMQRSESRRAWRNASSGRRRGTGSRSEIGYRAPLHPDSTARVNRT